MEQEPPPVTIVNPSGTAEVLADDGPRHGWALGLALLLVLGAAVTVSTVRDDHAADLAAIRAVNLSTDEAPDHPRPVGTTLVEVAVRNDGPDAVRVVSARLLGPGYRSVRVGVSIPPGTVGVLALQDTATCDPGLLQHATENVEVRLRTTRGSTVTRTLVLSPAAFRAVNQAARQRCGYLEPDQAFAFEPRSIHVTGRTVVVDGLLANRWLLPLRLFHVEPAPGLAVAASRTLPVDLPRLPTVRSPVRTVPLALTLSVRDCRAFVRSVSLGRGPASRELVRGWVVRDASMFEVPLLAVDPTSSYRPPVDPGDVITRLLETCPGTR